MLNIGTECLAFNRISRNEREKRRPSGQFGGNTLWGQGFPQVRGAGREPAAELVLGQIKEMPPCPVLDLDDPEVGIELQFAGEARFDIGVGRIDRGQDRREAPVAGPHLVEVRLRRGRIECRRAVELRNLDEDRARFFGTATADDGKRVFEVAAPHISSDPDGALETQGVRLFDRGAGHRREFADEPVADLARFVEPAVALETLDRVARGGIGESAQFHRTVTQAREHTLHGQDAR